MVDDRALPELVDAEGNLVTDLAGLDDARADPAVERRWHREDGLQRVALRATGRADVCFTRRRAAGVIEDIAHRVWRDPRPLIGDGDGAGRGRHVDRDVRRGAHVLAGV